MRRLLFFTLILISCTTLLTGQAREIVLQKGRFNSLSHVAYSADGARMAGTSVPYDRQGMGSFRNNKPLPWEDKESRVLVWDVRSGNMIANILHSTVTSSAGGSSSGWTITGLAVSSNGRFVATLQKIALMNKPTIYVWDLAAGTTAQVEAGRTEIDLKKDGFPQAIAFSPDDRYLVVAAKSINLYEIQPGETGAQNWQHTSFGENRKGYDAVAFCKDGNYLVGGAGDGTVTVWEVAARRQVAGFEADKPVVLVDISADGSRVVAANKKEEVYVWDVPGQKQLAQIGTKKKITSLALTPDGGQVLLRSFKDSDISIFESHSGRYLSALRGVVSEKAHQTSMGFDPAGRYLAVSAFDVAGARYNDPDEKVEVFDMASRQAVRTIRLRRPTPNKAIGFNSDNTRLYSLDGDHYFKEWDLIDASLASCFPVPANLQTIRFAGGIDRLVLTYSDRIELCRLSTFYSFEDREVLLRLPGQSYQVAGARLSIDKRRLIAQGTADKQLYVWDLEKGGSPLATLSAPETGPFENIALSAKGTYAIGRSGRHFSTWRVADQQLIHQQDTFALDSDHLSMSFQGLVALADDERFYLQFNEKHRTTTLIGNKPTEGERQLGININCQDKTVETSRLGFSEALGKVAELLLNKETSMAVDVTGERQVFSPDGQMYAWVKGRKLNVRPFNDKLSLQSAAGGSFESPEEVTGLAISNDGRFVAAAGPDGRISLWNAAKQQRIGQILHEKEKYIYLITDQDGKLYYKMSRGNQDLVSFRIGWEYYPFESFDLIHNRHDKVLEILTDPQRGIIAPDAMLENRIEAYRGAYLQRLQNAGLTEAELEFANAPQPIRIANMADLPIDTKEPVVNLEIIATDEKMNLKAIRVWVNGVPVYGRNGLDVSAPAAREVRKNLRIPLSDGDNKIQLASTNSKGIQSMVRTLQVSCSGPVRPRNLHLIAIGVDQFRDPAHNLSFAVKDAEDVARLFSGAPAAIYGQKFLHQLTNEEATRENIMALKTKLQNTTTEDAVIVFISTHGLRDHRSVLYFATPDCDFSDPAGAALSNQDLEELIDQIPARKRAVFIDACLSGEVNEANIELVKAANTTTGEVVFKSAEMKAQAISAQMEVEYGLMKEVFIDTRLGTGATIIAAAGGTQLAAETGGLGNGVFTAVFKKGLQEKLADLNGDGQILLSELRTYLSDQVEAESQKIGNRQRPTNRTENINNDWRIW